MRQSASPIVVPWNLALLAGISFLAAGVASAPQAKLADWYNQLKPEELHALGTVLAIAVVEDGCKEILGQYAPLEKLLEGCQQEGMRVRLGRERNPANDSNYHYRLTLRGDTYELSVTPLRPGLAGFFYDGKNIFANPTGAASSGDQLLGPPGAVLKELSTSARAPAPKPRWKPAAVPAEAAKTLAAESPKPAGEPAKPPGPTPSLQPQAPAAEQPKPAVAEPPKPLAVKKRKVWTEEDLQELKSGRVSTVGSRQSREMSASGEAGPRGDFSPEEQAARDYVEATVYMSYLVCMNNSSLRRFCNLEELAVGVEVDPGKVIGFRPGKDPRLDPNYEYRVIPVGGRLQVAAVPRRAGLGGFLYDEAAACMYYNPSGPATVQDKCIGSSLVVRPSLVRE